MANGVWLRPRSPHYITVEEAVSTGEIRQGADGRAYYRKSTQGASADQADVQFEDEGLATVVKAGGVVFLDGGRVYWDRSAGAATYKKVNDQDFYLGTSVGDASSASTSCTVKWNQHQERNVCLIRDPFATTIVGTQALGGLALNRRGGAHNIVLSSTNEAQKIDLLSKDGFSVNANAIIEGAFNVISDGSGSAVDVSMGIASASHATDADSIAEHIFFHLDANNVNINAQSKSTGKSTVTATDTTIDYTEGSGIANRVEWWMDCRNPEDVQLYINAVNVLPSSVFNISGATTLYLLFHVEKTSSTDTYEIDNEWQYARTAEQ